MGEKPAIVRKVAAALADLPVAHWIRVPINGELELWALLQASTEAQWAVTVNVVGFADVCRVDFIKPVKTIA